MRAYIFDKTSLLIYSENDINHPTSSKDDDKEIASQRHNNKYISQNDGHLKKVYLAETLCL